MRSQVVRARSRGAGPSVRESGGFRRSRPHVARSGRRSVRLGGAVLLGLLTVAGCTDDDPEPMTIEETDFAESLDVDLDRMTRLPSGVFIEVLEEGQGDDAVGPADRIDIETKGWLSDGTLFNEQRGVFSMLADPPPGFVDGLEGMRIDELRKIIVPWQLGFGAQGIGQTIPPFANLVFEVRLHEIL